MLCSGSWTLEQTLPKKPTTDVDADSGTKIHAAVARSIIKGEEDFRRLSTEEAERARACLRYYWDLPSAKEVLVEHTMSAGPVGGTADLIMRDDDKAHVVDWKTGSGGILRELVIQQLATYAYLTFSSFPVDVVEVSVYYPALDQEYTDTFHRDGVLDLEQRIERVVETVRKETQLSPGYEQCLHCRAKAICPAAYDELTALVKATPQHLDTPQKLGQAYDLAKRAEEFAKSLKGFVKERLQSGAEAEGWQLIQKQGRQYVKDVHAAIDAAYELGVEPARFYEALRVSLTKVKEVLGDDYEKWLNSAADAIDRHAPYTEIRRAR